MLCALQSSLGRYLFRFSSPSLTPSLRLGRGPISFGRKHYAKIAHMFFFPGAEHRPVMAVAIFAAGKPTNRSVVNSRLPRRGSVFSISTVPGESNGADAAVGNHRRCAEM